MWLTWKIRQKLFFSSRESILTPNNSWPKHWIGTAAESWRLSVKRNMGATEVRWDWCLSIKSLYKTTLGLMNCFSICDILGTADRSNSWQRGDGEVMLGARDSIGKQEINFSPNTLVWSALLCTFGQKYQWARVALFTL